MTATLEDLTPDLVTIVQPGDTLVLRYPPGLSQHEAEQVKARAGELMPDVRLVVMAGDVELAVHRPDPQAFEDAVVQALESARRKGRIAAPATTDSGIDPRLDPPPDTSWLKTESIGKGFSAG